MINRLNTLLNFSFSKSYYCTHPWKFFKELWHNIRNSWMRINQGWSYQDVWNLDSYFLNTFPPMLRHLANHSSGYPGTEPFETPEKWKEWLENTALSLENCKYEYPDTENEFQEEFDRLSELHRKERRDINGNLCISWEDNDEYNKIKKLFFMREKQIQDEKQERIEKTLAEIGRHFYSLWD